MKWIACLTLVGMCALTFTAFATPPVATPSFGQTWEDTEGEVVLNYTDDDGDLATECNVFLVVGGTVLETSVVEGVCTVTIMPDLNNDVNVTGLFNVIAGGEVSNDATFELDLIDVNDPPVITSEPPLTGEYHVSWLYTVVVEDVEGDELTYELIGDNWWGPSGEINQEGNIDWCPNFRGPVQMTVTVADDGMTNDQPDPQSTQQVFTVIIQPCLAYYDLDNSDPEFVILRGWWNTVDVTGAVGGSIRYTPAGDGNTRAGWRVDQVVESGLYDIYVWQFPSDHYPSLAHWFCYWHRHALGTDGVALPTYELPRGMWMPIGRYPFDNTSPQGTVLRSRDGGYVYADAVRYVKVSE